jgi:uncharacterized repeat protein (TIGR02543 family)
MKNRFLAAVLCGALLALIALIGCDNDFGPKAAKPAALKGTVRVVIADGPAAQDASRTAVPDNSGFAYTLTFTATGKDAVKADLNGNTTGEVSLDAGTWTLVVTGKKQGSTVAESNPMSVTLEGELITIAVTVHPVLNGNPGTFRYRIGVSGAVTGVSAVLTPLDVGSADQSETTLTIGDEKAVSAAPGYYRLKLRGEKGTQTLVRREVVHIYSYAETVKTYDLTEEDFAPSVYLAGTLTGGIEGYTAAAVFAYEDEEGQIEIGQGAVTEDAWDVEAEGTRETVYFKVKLSKDEDSGAYYSTPVVVSDIPVLGKTDLMLPVQGYTVTFDPNDGIFEGGGDTVTLQAPENGTLIPPAVSRSEYTFDGWYNTDIDDFTAETHVTGDLTVAARWKHSAALVTSISVAGVSVTTVPQAVSSADWTGVEFALSALESAKLGQVVINDGASLTDAQIVVAASAGATVRYASTAQDTPEMFLDADILTLSNNDYVCIQVTSEDAKYVNYYVIKVKLTSAVVTLAQDAVKVGDVTATLGTPNVDYSQTVAGVADLESDLNDKTVTVAVTGGQTVKYAKVTGSAAPQFGDTATFSFVDGDFLYLEVTAENGINKGVYKIEIWGARAAAPIISPAELPNAAYQISEESTPLTVTVSLPELEEIPGTSTISYQWYSNTRDSATGGTAIPSATEASFTPPTNTLGTTWYYVEVTHTDSAISAAPAKAVSTAARIRIVAEVDKVESVVSGSSNTVAYRFTLPQGKTWSDYTRITWDVLIDDMTTINMAATRAHIVGNYQESDFNSDTGVWRKLSDWNNARLVTISNNGNMSAILGSDYVPHTWKTLSYSIAADNALKDSAYNAETYYPAPDAAGPFYFGIGLSVNPNSNSTGVCRYFVRGMALSNEDGTEKVFADDLNTAFGNSLTLMDLKCIFNENTQIVRSLVNNPVPDEEE